MSRKTVATKTAKPAFSLISDAKLQELYSTMVKCRALGPHARRLGVRSSWQGLEAAIAGATADLLPEDAVVLRANPVLANFVKGVPLQEIFGGLAKGPSDKPKSKPASAASQAESALATGMAHAHAAGGKDRVTVAFLSEDPLLTQAGQDALEFARANKAPILYVYSGGPVDASAMGSRGYPVFPVDGSDAVAVYRVTHECMVRARQGAGPSVIVCTRFTVNGSGGKAPDCIRSMEKYLAAKGLFTEGQREAILRAFEREIKQALAVGKKSSRADTGDKKPHHVYVL